LAGSAVGGPVDLRGLAIGGFGRLEGIESLPGPPECRHACAIDFVGGRGKAEVYLVRRPRFRGLDARSQSRVLPLFARRISERDFDLRWPVLALR
jgi:hypothetical protein